MSKSTMDPRVPQGTCREEMMQGRRAPHHLVGETPGAPRGDPRAMKVLGKPHGIRMLMVD